MSELNLNWEKVVFKKGIKTKSEYEAIAELAQDSEHAAERGSPKREREELWVARRSRNLQNREDRERFKAEGKRAEL